MMAWRENVLLCRSELELETVETFLTMIHYFFVWFGELRVECDFCAFDHMYLVCANI